MAVKIGIVDYQMGNLRSVAKAVERLGGTPVVSDQPSILNQTNHLILPGVGAFRDAIAELQRRELVEFIRGWVREDRPFLGICLGLQLLFNRSFEGGEYEGLGILPGEIVKFEFPEHDLKVPHMGWNQVESRSNEPLLLAGTSENPYFYFVHSFYAVPDNPDDLWLTSDYGAPFCAAVRRGNLYATQFHPEKSQRDGLQLLNNFIGTN